MFENGKEAGLVDFPAAEHGNADSDAIKVAYTRAEAEANLWVKGRRVYSNRRRRLVVHPALAILMGLAVVIVLYNILKFI